jgi:ABC-type polysaccharide/polyol phosphate export permease
MTSTATRAVPLIEPFRVLLAHRRTIGAFVRRDIRARYVTSVMGVWWAVVQPLALLALYTFVFSYVLGLRFGGTASEAGFAVYLFCGMLPWLAFAEGVSRSATVILDQASLIKKVVFPSEILPAYVVTSALVTELVALAVFAAGVSLVDRRLGWPLLLLPLVVALQFIFTMGLAWALSSLNVFLRDVGQVLGLVMTCWMFLTPVFYPAELVPARARWLLELNPMYHVVQAYRDVVLERQPPGWASLAALTAIALGTFVLGHWLFRRSKHAFVDVL